METNLISSYDNLKKELDNAKHTLVTLNDDIRRIIGRPKDLRSDKHKSHETKRNESDRANQKILDSPKFKRRNYEASSVFNRLSAQPSRSADEEFRPRLNSRVIRELPTRQEIVAAQGTDSESRARNRRMFGSLLGTLHKFCQEESRLKQKEDKKAQIERKLEQQELQERETLKRERELLFMNRKRKQFDIRRLELKMSRLKDFEIWESSMSQLRHHIRTKTKPYLYFRPHIMSKKTEKLLMDNRAYLEKIVDKKRDTLNKELAELEKILNEQEYENEEHFDHTANNENSVADESRRSQELLPKYEFHSNKANSSVVLEVSPRKGDFDFKENKSRNLIDPAVSSSVVVVKNLQKSTNKLQ